MRYIVTINNNEYEVEVEEREAQVLNVTPAAPQPAASAAPGAATPASVVTAAPSAAPVQDADGDKVTAPMPGVVLDIKKGSGTQVKKGETILLLEAMKMENEIVAPRDGVITHIAIVKGATVNTGDVLAVIQ